MKITQVIVDAYGCQGSLEDSHAIETRAVEAATAIGATVIRTVTVPYEPQGVTVVLLLAESHIIISTWPEFKYAGIEVLLCNETMDANALAATICDLLSPTEKKIHCIERQIDAPTLTSSGLAVPLSAS